MLCNVHGVTAPIRIEIDGADLHGDLEGGRIEILVSLPNAHQCSGHCHEVCRGLFCIGLFDVRNVCKEVLVFRCTLLFTFGDFVEQAITASLAHIAFTLDPPVGKFDDKWRLG